MERESDRAAPPAPPPVKPARVLVKALVLLAFTVAGVGIYRTTPVAGYFEPGGPAAIWLGDLGPLGPLVFCAGMAAAILVGVPRLLFCPLAGALFGFWGGIGISVAGTLASYYVAFVFLRERYTGSPPRLLLHPKLAFLGSDPGFGGVVIARLLPVPGMVGTVALSLSGVGHRAYLGGSAIGLLPEAVPLVLLGAGMLHGDAVHIAKLAVIAVVCVVASWLVMQHAVKRRLRDAGIASGTSAEA